jgi:serine/threonine-protein kinase
METGPVLKIGRYEVKEKIAAGGMATVYRAIQTGIGGFRSVVAVKILHPHLAKEQDFRKMFLDEATIGALLRHRCLLNVLDYGEEEGVAYIVTEFFPSISLEDLAQKVGKVPLAEALFTVAEAAEGLAALHEAKDLDNKKLGLVHRDVSPHNLLVASDGRVKLIDYGIVKRKDPTEKTRPGIVKGKCRYMSPEQAGGGAVDARSDLYALGVVLLRCLTGGKPHGDGNTSEILAKARKGLNWQRECRPLSLPEPVDEFLGRLLAIDPAERFASGNEVAREARKLLAALKPGYESHAFGKWVEKATRKDRTRGTRSAEETSPDDAEQLQPVPASRGRPRDKGAANGAERSGERGAGARSRGDAGARPGIHPRWVFLGFGLLFAAALAAYLLHRVL